MNESPEKIPNHRGEMMASYNSVLQYFLTLAPFLFPDEDEVLDHLFLTVGSGIVWQDGGLDPIDAPDLSDPERAAVEIRIQCLEEELREIASQIARSLHHDSRTVGHTETSFHRIRENRVRLLLYLLHQGEIETYILMERAAAAEMAEWESDAEIGREFETWSDPCGRSNLFRIPDDVRSDWLEAAERGLQLARRRPRTGETNARLDDAERRMNEIRRNRCED